MIVRPETVVRWHRKGVRLYWRARRIQAELEKLGIKVGLATMSRYLPKKEPDRELGDRAASRSFSDETSIRFLIHDNDSIFSDRVLDWIEQLGIEPKATAYRCRWQNGLSERWVGTVRRDPLDHVVPIDREAAGDPVEAAMLNYS